MAKLSKAITAASVTTEPADDIAALRNPPFEEHISQLAKLLSHGRRSFVLGAGCSKCAGLPLMEELTQAVLKSLPQDGKSYKILTGLQSHFSGANGCSIEDYMSELVDYIDIAERRRLRSAVMTNASINSIDYDSAELTMALVEIKNAIAEVIRKSKQNISVHQQFVRAIHYILQSGKAGPHAKVDYYTLNYDTLFEDALSLERIPVADGFNGGVTGWWDAHAYQSDSVQARVFKVHGSIDWCLWDNDVLPRRVRQGLGIDNIREPVLIWPASTKYREAQRDPFAHIIDAMRKSLLPPSDIQGVLAICGYSFGDSHINIELDRALHESSGRLTIIAFTNEDEPKGQLQEWRNDPSVFEQVRIYANKGFFHGNKESLSDVSLLWWKFEILTRLLGGER